MKESEKRLLFVFVTLLALVGGLILGNRFQQWNHLLDRQARELELKSMEADALLQDGDAWKAREAWLAEHQPKAGSELEADEHLSNTLAAKAQENGVSIAKSQYQAPVNTPYFDQHGVSLTVKGDLPGVLRWLYSLQTPSEFRVVPSIKITPDKEDATKVDCVVDFWRWYRPELAKNVP